MTIKSRIFTVATLILLLGCKAKTDYAKNYSNSSTVAFNLLKQSVDTITNTTPSMNTANYVLDLSSIDSLNKQGVDSFLHIKNRQFTTTLDDSTMIFIDGDPSNFRMKQSMIIKIRTITYKSEKSVVLTASKIKSSNEIIDATIDLERRLDGYKITNFKITN